MQGWTRLRALGEPTAYFSDAPPKGLGTPSYLEMPVKAQMFSVRLPSLSTRHEGPPGPRGQASHASGTMETIQGSEEERWSPPTPSPAHAHRPHHRHRSRPSLHTFCFPRGTAAPRHISRHSPSPVTTHQQLRSRLCKPLGTQTRLHPRALPRVDTRPQHSRAQASTVTAPQTRTLRPTLADSRSRARPLTGLPSRQLQLRLVGAGAVGPGADHLAADGLLAHQRGRAVRVPQAGVAGAPAAFRLRRLLLGHQEDPAGAARLRPSH